MTATLTAAAATRTPNVLTVTDPDDGSTVDIVPSATVADIGAALDAAAAVAPVMRGLATHERMTALTMAADSVTEDHAGFAETIAREGVKTIREAEREVTRCVETLRISAEEARRLGGEIIAFDQRPGSERRFGWVERTPIGPIAAITPFNDPLNLVAHKIGPAIAAGCPIIVKPHHATPLSALRLAATFERTELPAAAVQVITGRGREIGDSLVSDPRVRMITFTGGPEVGRRVAALAGARRLGLELGSNSPVIVMPDADLDVAVSATLSGAFWAAGQNCLHAQRVIVHDAVYGSFREAIVAGAAAYRLGPKRDRATDMGPLIDEQAADRVEAMVDDAIRRGGRRLTGHRIDATHIAPTILENVPADAALRRDEVFGPVTVLIRMQSLADAIAIANETEYGLHAAIFTADLATAFTAIHDLDCGAVLVNDSTDYRIDAMPFGGVKGSGLGREGVRSAVEAMTEPKVACLNL